MKEIQTFFFLSLRVSPSLGAGAIERVEGSPGEVQTPVWKNGGVREKQVFLEMEIRDFERRKLRKS